MNVPPGTTDESVSNTPAREILKRIDIGLTTGIAALLLSFVGIMTSRATLRMNQETQKARVLPIVQIEMGYTRLPAGTYDFAISLTNSGSGLAHIQRIAPVLGGEDLAGYQAFQDAIMNRRMRGWARLEEKPGGGYLRPGETRRPVYFAMNSASNEVQPYLRGEGGATLLKLDVEACYCSVFEDCWTVRFRDRSQPTPVDQCTPDGSVDDRFADYRDQRLRARIKADDD